jgi:deoxyribodipyrimidine photo-lyase
MPVTHKTQSSSSPPPSAPPEKQHFEKGLFVFHRDLRIVDNVGLLRAAKECRQLYTCFIFTPEQIGTHNKYRSKNAIQFMMESLGELSKEIREHGGELIVLFGDTTTMIRFLVHRLDVSAIYTNKDYTPYAIEREASVSRLSKSLQKTFIETNDYYLYEPGSVTTSTGKFYQKFTPFYDAVVSKQVPAPQMRSSYRSLSKFSGHLEYRTTLKDVAEKYGSVPSPTIVVNGGRKRALVRLRRATHNQSHYTVKRDQLIYETTLLSAYIKFGCVSVREVYHAFVSAYGRGSGLVRELIWREFFAHVLFGFSGVLDGYTYKGIHWRTSKSDFEKWKKGQTGVPIVDACMRQMNETGYMHNRGRMIVANFLVKTLLLNWKWGEEYFARTLVDYDVASNNGNWQSISGTGADQKPYFRDMNPWIQSAKFDVDAEYIKKWVPELRNVEPNAIHKWELYWNDAKYKKVAYPKPMVAYGEQKPKMLEMYRDAK